MSTKLTDQEQIRRDNSDVASALETYQKQIQAREARRLLVHEQELEAANTAVTNYEQQIAPREARRDAEQTAHIASLQSQYDALVGKLPAQVEQFAAANRETATTWTPRYPA